MVADPGIPEPPAPPAPNANRAGPFDLDILKEWAQTHRFLTIGASVYEREKETLSHFQIWYNGEYLEGWSNVDFGHLACLGGIESDGVEYSFMLLATRIPQQVWQGQLAERTGKMLPLPDHPALPEGEATFVLTRCPQNNSDAFRFVAALHDVYRSEKEALKEAFVKRQQYQREAKAWRKAHPPQAKDVHASFWRK